MTINLNYCPDWIFDIVLSEASKEYIAEVAPLYQIGMKFSDGLSINYQKVHYQEIISGIEEYLRFLFEINITSEAYRILNDFSFYRSNYKSINSKRRKQLFFRDIEAGEEKKNYTIKTSLRNFKAYVFSHRAMISPVAPKGWKLENETKIEKLNNIIYKK